MTTIQTKTDATVLFQTSYGAFRTLYLCFLPVLGIIGLVGIPLGIFSNEGWEMNNRPMEPWAAAMMIEIFAVGAMLMFIAGVVGTLILRKSPQRVAVTESSLIVPKGMFSSVELVLPRSEINVAVFDMGFVKQLQIKHKRRKIVLTSARFASDAEFDQLASHLPH